MTSVKKAAAWMAFMGFTAVFVLSSAQAQDAAADQPADSRPTTSESAAAGDAAPAPEIVEPAASGSPAPAPEAQPDASPAAADQAPGVSASDLPDEASAPAPETQPAAPPAADHPVSEPAPEKPKVVFKHISLHQAAFDGDMEEVAKFISAGADVNSPDKDSIKANHWSDLTSHWASKAGPTATAAIWDASRAEVGLMGGTGDRPLHRATYGEHPEVVELLLENGADLNARNEKGWTALHVAALCGNTRVIKILLGRGADVNARDHEDVSPLHMAAESGCYDAARLLLVSMADPNVQDKQGITPLHWAVYGAHNRLARLLLSSGAKLNTRDSDGRTPKRWAAVQILRVRGHGDLCNHLALRGGIE